MKYIKIFQIVNHPETSEKSNFGCIYYLVAVFYRLILVEFSYLYSWMLFFCVFFSPWLSFGWYIQAYLVLLCFTDIAFFTNWRFVAILCPASLSVPFSNSICSLHVSVSHLSNSCKISKLFFIIIFVMWFVISDVCYHYNSLKAQMMVSIFSNKVSLNLCTLFF